ncbi:MAG: hypothetical protein AB7O96_10700 [Pseudobdellovibrionaceae bacterium]
MDSFEIEKERIRSPRKSPETPKKRRLPDVTDLVRERGLTWDENISFRRGPRRSPRQVASWSMAASFIDFLLLLALNCFLVVVTIAITQNNPFQTLPVMIYNPFVWILFGQVIATSWGYMVSLRSFLGFSIGEWACHLRLGDDRDFAQSNYTLRVIARCTLVLASGMILLPILTLITGNDLAGKISGLQIKIL